MKRIVRFVCAAGLCFVLLSVACYAEEPIYIGLSAPMTGQYAGYGDTFKKAIALAIGKVNDIGGINKRPIELMIEDSQGDPKISKRIARKFTDDNRIIAEIGDFTSTCSMASSPIYQRGNMVQLSPTASHPSFALGSPFSFSVSMTHNDMAPIMAANAVKKLLKKRIAVLYINNAWGIALQKFFTDEAKQLDAEIVAVETYLEGNTDFKPVLEKLRASDPDLLVIFLMDIDGALFNKQRKDIGWDDIAVMGDTPLYSQKFLEIGGDAVENVYSFTSFFPKSQSSEVQKFVKAYETQYHEIPDIFAARAYDSANLLIEAIKKDGTDRKTIRDALASIKDFPGTTGKISFNEQGNVLKEFLLLQVKNGEFVLYSGK